MEKRFLIGCCYYPEHWDRANMRTDIAKIKALGFNVVRMGEFSWSMYEKEEGKYDFSLLREAVELLDEAGISVILGTPTATPPKWLTDRYPEVLCKNRDGITMQHGSRQQHNHTSEIYLKYCALITEAMVKAFADCKNVIGWQIDNELNCQRNEAYAESDDLAFQKWLEEKYTTIDALNTAWGTRFWSLEFNDFAQIRCPGPTPTAKNPSLLTDYYLFISDSVINYAAIQVKILRKYMPDAFITHNGWFENINYKQFTREYLDFLAFDSYPLFQEKSGVGLGRNVEYPLSRMRGASGEYVIMEQQAGPGGQLANLMPTPQPGQIRLWTYQSIAHGAVGVLYFRYKTAVFGAEQLWYGIYDYDGEENYRSREVRQVAEELSRLGNLFLTERIRPEVAIYNDYHNLCCNKAESFFKDDTWEIFTALNRKNVHSDIIYSADELANYKVVIFPHIAIADEALREKIEAFTAAGGIAILSARCGVKDENAHYRQMKSPGIFRELAGCRCDWFSSTPDYSQQSVNLFGKTYPVGIYYEMLETEGGEALGTYTEGFCKGKTAIVKNGNVYYLGFYIKGLSDVYYDIIRQYIDVPADHGDMLEEVRLGEYTMYLNHGDSIYVMHGYDYLKGESFEEIPAYGVVLVKA